MSEVRFGSVCSGIEAASVAWNPLGWKAAWLSEIEPFPSALLTHHYPDVPNLGDMTALPGRIASGEVEAPDVLCGGTPCQAFSVAGLRQSLDDSRGNLSLTFCEIANAIDDARLIRREQPAVIFWENVPGVLSTKDNAFGCFLAGLTGEDDPLVAPGGKWTNAGCVFGPQRTVAWRVLDAQYFGVAQRRKRVFVVASARKWFDPAAVLFEFDGLRRDSAPSREAGEKPSHCVTNGPPFSRTGNERVETEAIVIQGVEIGPGGGQFTDVNPTLDTRAKDGPIRNQLAGAVLTTYLCNAEGGAVDVPFMTASSQMRCVNNQTPLLSVAMINMQGSKGNSVAQADGPSYTLNAMHGHDVHAIAFDAYNQTINGDVNQPIRSGTVSGQVGVVGGVLSGMQVRRLTPVECERLQGFPDFYTDIQPKGKPTPDGPRYKALGNSWAVPVVRWIGRRIDSAMKEQK